MVMEESLKSGAGHMKEIFDLCDQDNDGLICAQDFKKIGQDHFEKPHFVEALLKVMDPTGTGKISFVMFCRGVENFLLENQHGSTSSESSVTSLDIHTAGANDANSAKGLEDCDGDNDDDNSTSIFTGSDSIVYPMSPGACSESNVYTISTGAGSESPTSTGPPAGADSAVYPGGVESSSGPSNGYMSNSSSVELIVDPCEDDNTTKPQPVHSTPGSRSRSPGRAVSRESPTMTARHLLRRHQLTLPDGSSQGSSPAEGEAEVTRLSDQLHELSSRLGELEEEQKGGEGYRMRLKKDNAQLKLRLEECEDTLRATELASQKALTASQDQLRIAVSKVRRESENQMLDLQSQLSLANDRISQLESREISLKTQLLLSQEEKLLLEKGEAEQEERCKLVEEELRRTRELVREERNKWKREQEALTKTLSERDVMIGQLQQECEEAQMERKRRSIMTSDMDREIDRITKLLEKSYKDNEQLQSRFFQEGKQLVIASSAPRSLAMEIESVSKDEVMKALRESEEMNQRQNQYIDGLLTTIMEKHPEMLEKS